ncbi:uncharacterized protein LOC114928495 isoform X1 [Nylanderia fulva]|uniref:uncharacterized protein LOC114928495 isoform X1 n=2 Tax=Nylanderia fulva TaxID=613905 RepID=UPI0010FAE951|nr:uncharacterized protein LOC114928495 isoform X1 [Nylanderia fulva]
MAEQIKNIDKYYTDLQYDIDKTNAIVFINTYMDFTGGLLFVPIAKFLDNFTIHTTVNSMDKTDVHENNILLSTNNISRYSSEYKNYSKIIHLFYDGMWQNPVQNSYFKHEEQLFANATNEDIRRCIKSARKGFKIWDANSIVFRKKILSNFALALSYNCEPTLSSLIEGCTKFITFYENSNGYCTQNLELINSSKAIGIIILREKNETILLLRLTQCLLAGNSVIVICNEKFSNIKSYLNIFSMCDIPPGVLNMLSSECIENLESRLCGIEYSDYAKQYFSEEPIFEKYKNYTNLYLEKQIAHVLK